MQYNKKLLVRIVKLSTAAAGAAFAGLSAAAAIKKGSSVFNDDPSQKNPFEGKKVFFVENENDKENADGVKGHLEEMPGDVKSKTVYDKYVKRAIDVTLSFAGLAVLSPVYAALALAIKIDDPGPVLFTQKRVGQNKQYFKLHKFRSMKMSTPHDVPTHMLENPEQYITRVGKLLRKYSLDELPQIWDIFIGNMSIIGPRPALWNQDVLTAERDKYGANDVKPGLTGWAQINGRDELEITDKAELDGEYTEKMSLLFDIKCFFGTILSVLKHDGVVEGGTGEMNKEYGEIPKIAEFSPDIDFTEKKRILIAGENSYIGEALKKYLLQFKNYDVEMFSTLNEDWKELDFSGYDAVCDVAGIAHIKETEENRQLFFDVNCTLACEIAEKAKTEGVRKFIYLSSMSVYGINEGHITKDTLPSPNTAYGKSKLMAEAELWKLNGASFSVCIVRPPMVYGKNCKGNYQTLRRFALVSKFCPEIRNERSMIHIDNLSAAICGVIHNESSGVYFPQNKDYVCTSEMIESVAELNLKKVIFSGILNPAVKIAAKKVNIFKKVFGSLTYDKSMNVPLSWLDTDSTSETMKKTECAEKEKKKVLILSNEHSWTYNLRRETIQALLDREYEVTLALPYGERIEDLKKMGCLFIDVPMLERRGINAAKEAALINEYIKIMYKLRPDVVLTYTAKPNIYGSIAAHIVKVPVINNVTGFGSVLNQSGVMQKFIMRLFKAAYRNSTCVMFQNETNMKLADSMGMVKGKKRLIPGSGVNTDAYPLQPYPDGGNGKDGEPVVFNYIGRILHDKGVDDYIENAKRIKAKYPNTQFNMIGFVEPTEMHYEQELQELERNGIIHYIGSQKDVKPFIASSHATIHPSTYGEGMSNVLLESASSGRVLITTDNPGCFETVEDGKTGYIYHGGNVDELYKKTEEFLALSNEERKKMGEKGREYIKANFSRSIVVSAYLDEIKNII